MPVGENFLYVESIYIQAESAQMPQLRKVVLAMGEQLVYEDSFEQALARLEGRNLRAIAEAQESEPAGGARVIEISADPGPGDVQRRLAALRRQVQQFLDELSALENVVAQ